MERNPLGDLLFSRPAWMSRGACVNTDPNLFITHDQRTLAQAKAICQTCPVIDECLAYACADLTLAGIWGGVGQTDRSRMMGFAGISKANVVDEWLK